LKNNINIMLYYSSGSWEYIGHHMYDISDEDGSPIIRAAVHLRTNHGKNGSLRVDYVTITSDSSQPFGFDGFEYMDLHYALEDQNLLDRLPPDFGEFSEEYLVLHKPESYQLHCSTLDHDFEEVLRIWLEKYLAVDGFLDKIKSMIESIRNKSSSTEEDKIVPDSKKKSNGGVEDDIT